MAMHSRRDFLKTGAAGLLGSSALLGSNNLFAQTLGLPPGLQLYSVRKELPNDYAGTLKQVGALGYRQVEAAGYFNHTAEEVNKAMRDAGLNLVSAHYPMTSSRRTLMKSSISTKNLECSTSSVPRRALRIPHG